MAVTSDVRQEHAARARRVVFDGGRRVLPRNLADGAIQVLTDGYDWCTENGRQLPFFDFDYVPHEDAAG